MQAETDQGRSANDGEESLRPLVVFGTPADGFLSGHCHLL